MPALYLDMDGVLADFKTQAQLKIDPAIEDITGEFTESQWQKFQQHPRWFMELPEMPLARLLMDVSMTFQTQLGWDLRILTAVPQNNRYPWAFYDKVEWMRSRWPQIPVFFGPYAQDKQLHSLSGDILVDDKIANCEQWQARGGTALHHSDRDQGMQAIQDLIRLFRRQGGDPEIVFGQ